MKRGSFFSVAKERNPKKRVSYKRGNFKGNQYVFYEPSESEDESEEEVFVLRQKKEAEKFVERVLQPGDTLLNIALQHGYSVQELKRINHIHKDNEIFARTTLKVPTKIMETAAVHKQSKELENELLNNKPENTVAPENNHVRTVSISDPYRESKLEGNDSDAARRFLVSMDQDLARIRESTSAKGHVGNYDFVVTELGIASAPPGSLSSGAVKKPDTNWTWVQLIICYIILGFITPIAIVVYLAEKSTKPP